MNNRFFMKLIYCKLMPNRSNYNGINHRCKHSSEISLNKKMRYKDNVLLKKKKENNPYCTNG
jgi:hypothetical protein